MEKTYEKVLEFFDLLQVPIEIEQLNLDHFKCIVDQAIHQHPI